MPDTIRITIEVTKEELGEIIRYLNVFNVTTASGHLVFDVVNRILRRLYDARPKEQDDAGRPQEKQP